jgi:hypothetical protein
MVAGVDIVGPGDAPTPPGPGTEERAPDTLSIVAQPPFAASMDAVLPFESGLLLGPRTGRSESMSTITREQRDAIYEVVMNRLSGIEDVWMALEQPDFATAKRLGRLFAEDLRLLEDLGWSDRIDGETVELTLPLVELTRMITRLHKDSAGSLGTYVLRYSSRRLTILAARSTSGSIVSSASL